MEVKMEQGWKDQLTPEFSKPYFKALTDTVRRDYANPAIRVYPPGKDIFAAFNASPFNETKVVIIGQDPYHGPGQANGLCFSVSPGVQMPPLLSTFSRKCTRIPVHPFQPMATCHGGRNRVCFSSILL